MSSLNFPTNPTIGQTYVLGTKTYTWSGSAWLVTNSGSFVANSGTFSQVYIQEYTDSDSTTTGALVVNGGVGIGGDLYIGGVLSVAGAIILTTSSFNVEVSEGNDIDINVDPLNNNLIVISNISTLQSVTSRGFTTTNRINITNTTPSTSISSGALTVSGGIGVNGNGWFAGTLNATNINLTNTIFFTTVTNIATTSPSIIDLYSLTTHRSAKYFIQISEGVGSTAEFHAQEITVIASNTGSVFINEYGMVSTNGNVGLGTFNAEVDGSNVKLLFTPTSATNKVIKLLRTAITV